MHNMNDLTHSVLDVKGDGNCFYRAILKAIANDHNTLEIFGLQHDETVVSAIEKLRYVICDFILSDAATKKWIMDFQHLSQSSASVLDDFPAVKKVIEIASDGISREDISENDFLNMLCQQIITDRTWASDIEISILKERLMTFCNIHLIIIKARDKHQILHTFKVEKQLLFGINRIHDQASVDERMSMRCLVLIQINNNHYMYLVLQRIRTLITLPPVQALKLYLDDLLQDCEDADEDVSYDEDVDCEFSAFQIPNRSDFRGLANPSKNEDAWTANTFGLHSADTLLINPNHEIARKFL